MKYRLLLISAFFLVTSGCAHQGSEFSNAQRRQALAELLADVEEPAKAQAIDLEEKYPLPPPPKKIRQATDAELRLILESLDSKLKDGESARLRNVVIRELPDKGYFCGEVNAKNSYGGYVGYTMFYGIILEAEGSNHFFAMDVDGASYEMCKMHGVI